MSMNDTISDMITRIRNAQNSKRDSVNIPNSKTKKMIAEVLKNEGYIQSYNIFNLDKKISIIKIILKYYFNKPVIKSIKRISKPGLRIYKNKKEIVSYNFILGVIVLSTSKGIISDRVAKFKNVGGEVLFFIN